MICLSCLKLAVCMLTKLRTQSLPCPGGWMPREVPIWRWRIGGFLESYWSSVRDAGFCQHWTVSALTSKTMKAELLLCIWPHRKVLSTLSDVLPSSVNPSRNYLPTSPHRRVSRLPSDFLKLTIRISYHNSYCSWNLSGFEESRRRFIVLNKNAMLWNLCKISYDFQNHTGSTVMAGAVYQLNGIWNRLGVCVCV